jgi:hypothetical protein
VEPGVVSEVANFVDEMAVAVIDDVWQVESVEWVVESVISIKFAGVSPDLPNLDSLSVCLHI